MATQALSREQRLHRISWERRYFLGMGVLILLIAFIGFAPTYYLQPWLQGRTSAGLPATEVLVPLVHVHALLSTAWVLLFIVQSALVTTGNLRVHRRVGPAALGLAVAMVVTAWFTTQNGARLGHKPPGVPMEVFIVMPLSSIVLFVGFVGAAFLLRRRPAAHKRLMLIGTIAILVPAFARMHFNLFPAGAVGSLASQALLAIIALVADTAIQRRLHPAMAWGVGLLLASMPLRFVLTQTAAWKEFAAWFIG